MYLVDVNRDQDSGITGGPSHNGIPPVLSATPFLHAINILITPQCLRRVILCCIVLLYQNFILKRSVVYTYVATRLNIFLNE